MLEMLLLIVKGSLAGHKSSVIGRVLLKSPWKVADGSIWGFTVKPFTDLWETPLRNQWESSHFKEVCFPKHRFEPSFKEVTPIPLHSRSLSVQTQEPILERGALRMAVSSVLTPEACRIEKEWTGCTLLFQICSAFSFPCGKTDSRWHNGNFQTPLQIEH